MKYLCLYKLFIHTCRNITGESLITTCTASPDDPGRLRAELPPPLPAAPGNVQYSWLAGLERKVVKAIVFCLGNYQILLQLHSCSMASFMWLVKR